MFCESHQFNKLEFSFLINWLLFFRKVFCFAFDPHSARPHVRTARQSHSSRHKTATSRPTNDPQGPPRAPARRASPETARGRMARRPSKPAPHTQRWHTRQRSHPTFNPQRASTRIRSKEGRGPRRHRRARGTGRRVCGPTSYEPLHDHDRGRPVDWHPIRGQLCLPLAQLPKRCVLFRRDPVDDALRQHRSLAWQCLQQEPQG